MSTSKGKTASVEELTAMIQRLSEENNALKAREPTTTVINPKEPLKVPAPQFYEGKPGTLRTYLTQARLYVKFQSTALPYVSDQVTAVAAYLKGDAAAWFEPTMREYLEKGAVSKCTEKTKEIFSNYNKYEKALKEAFGNPDEERDFERQLLQLKQTSSAQEHASKFRQVAAHLEWDDEPLMVQFYKGLKDRVKDELIKEERPDTLGAYMERAIRIDNRLYEREQERRNKGWAPQHHKKRHGTSYGHHSGPMELDAALKRPTPGKETRKCYNCGKAGHLSRNCRQPRKKFERVPEEKRRVNAAIRRAIDEHGQMEPEDHASMDWTVCFKDECTIHLSEKQGAGWFPRKPRWLDGKYGKTIAVITKRTKGEGSDQHANKPPPLRRSEKGIRVQERHSDNDEEEEELPEHFGILPGMRRGDRPAPVGTAERLVLPGVSLREAHERPYKEIDLDSDRRLRPMDREHQQISWAACVNDSCPYHLGKKAVNNFFPRKATLDERIEDPYLEMELEHWIVTHRRKDRTVFELDPHIPLDCLLGKNQWDDCDTTSCKLHMEEKAKDWHRRMHPRQTKGKTPTHRRPSVIIDEEPLSDFASHIHGRIRKAEAELRHFDIQVDTKKHWEDMGRVAEGLEQTVRMAKELTSDAGKPALTALQHAPDYHEAIFDHVKEVEKVHGPLHGQLSYVKEYYAAYQLLLSGKPAEEIARDHTVYQAPTEETLKQELQERKEFLEQTSPSPPGRVEEEIRALLQKEPLETRADVMAARARGELSTAEFQDAYHRAYRKELAPAQAQAIRDVKQRVEGIREFMNEPSGKGSSRQ
jgi:hypothetical protein